MTRPDDQHRESFHAWLDAALPEPIPVGVAAFILFLYEGVETFDAQIAGARHFDARDAAGVSDLIFSSGENLFSVRRTVVDGSWQSALRVYDGFVTDYLSNGRRRDVMIAAKGVGVGVVDGDVVLIHPRSPAERVHAVFDYFDGPRSGVADFEGRPHAFVCEFDNDLEDWSEFYHLKPLNDEEFTLVMIDWEIWTRWRAAYHSGLAPLATHPALPTDASLHEQIAPTVTAALAVDTTTATVVWPSFYGQLPPDGELKVSWSRVSRS